MRLNWGTAILAIYTAFAVATMTFVTFAMRRPVDLVSPDYYAQSLRQDERMQAIRQTQALRPAPAIVQTGPRAAVVSLPPEHAPAARGTATLYRASDASADQVRDLSLDADGRQQISLDGLAAGRWMLKVHWTADGREYYVEQPLVAR